jgi:SWI/SNF-related matrix-associated actin-dependent regulator 1 of chromatin subfamily A
MIVTYWKGVFVVDKPEKPEEKAAIKKANFTLHDPSTCVPDDYCRACRAHVGVRYWSDKIESAARLRSYCNKLALTVMREHLSKLAKSRATTSDIVIPSPQGLSYLPYQRAGIAYMLEHKDTYLGDDMGLGKTIQALGFTNYLRTTKPQLNTVVLCPSTLTFNWRNEASKWLTTPHGNELPQIVIPNSNKYEVPTLDNLFVILNYEKLINDNPLSRSLARVWDVLICDEAHALKNWSAKRTQSVLGEEGLMRRTHRTVFLSGTPLENYPKEIWTIAASVCPAKFGNWWSFAKRYCGLHKEETGYGSRVVDTGATHLGELRQRLRATFMIRRLKKDVLKELPPKRRQLVVLGDSKVDWSLDPDFKRWHELYDQAYEARLAALESAKTQDEYKKAAKRLEEFTGVAFKDMSALRHKTAVAKLPACIAYVDELLEAHVDKLVIFAHHRDVMNALAEKYGNQAVSIHGGTSKIEREKAVKKFQEGDARIFIGELKTAGVGLNLHAASTVVFIEIDWNPAKLTQAEDRLCRIGQKKMVHVIHLVLDGTLDVNMCKRILKKQNMFNEVLNILPEHDADQNQRAQLALPI